MFNRDKSRSTGTATRRQANKTTGSVFTNTIRQIIRHCHYARLIQQDATLATTKRTSYSVSRPSIDSYQLEIHVLVTGSDTSAMGLLWPVTVSRSVPLGCGKTGFIIWFLFLRCIINFYSNHSHFNEQTRNWLGTTSSTLPSRHAQFWKLSSV